MTLLFINFIAGACGAILIGMGNLALGAFLLSFNSILLGFNLRGLLEK